MLRNKVNEGKRRTYKLPRQWHFPGVDAQTWPGNKDMHIRKKTIVLGEHKGILISNLNQRSSVWLPYAPITDERCELCAKDKHCTPIFLFVFLTSTGTLWWRVLFRRGSITILRKKEQTWKYTEKKNKKTRHERSYAQLRQLKTLFCRWSHIAPCASATVRFNCSEQRQATQNNRYQLSQFLQTVKKAELSSHD